MPSFEKQVKKRSILEKAFTELALGAVWLEAKRRCGMIVQLFPSTNVFFYNKCSLSQIYVEEING